MNKKLFLGMFAAAGMLLATSCSNDELDAVQSGNEARVSFSLGLEGGIATRAISDGTGADKLVYAVFDKDGNRISTIAAVEKDKVTFPATETLTLAKGQTYKVAFWAQDTDCGAYTVDTETMSVSVDYEGLNNDETRDAFFKAETFTVSGNAKIDVVLKRPFAQINVGVYQTDWDAAVASGITIEESSVVIKNAATSINLLDGSVSGETEVSYSLAAIPTEKLEVETDAAKEGKEKYTYLSMSYILPSAAPTGYEKATLEGLSFTFAPNPQTGKNPIVFSEGLTNVPVQRNWRTNILGQLLTGTIDFNITIDPIYDGDHNIIDGTESTNEIAPGVTVEGNTYRISSAAGLGWLSDVVNGTATTANGYAQDFAQSNFSGKTVVLTNDIDLANVVWTPIGTDNAFEGTFDGGNHTISNLTVNVTDDNDAAGLFAEARIVKNVKMSNVNISGHYKAGAIVGDGLCAQIENCHVDGGTITSTPNSENNNANNVGGIVGYLSAEPTAYVKQSSVKNLTITAYRSVGGVAGRILGGNVVVENCIVDNVTVIADRLVDYAEPGKTTAAGPVVGDKMANADLTTNKDNNVTVKIYGIENNVATVGTATGLTYALENANSVFLTENINLETINLTTVTKDIVIDADGNTITTSGNYGVETGAGKNVTIKNAVIEMTLNGTSSAYTAGFKIANGNYDGNTIKLENCTITMANNNFAYAVTMPANVTNLNLVIDNCTLEGAIALQCWGDNNTVEVNKSKLICNYDTNQSFGSSCIALQRDNSYEAQNNTFTVNGCEFSYTGTNNYNKTIHSLVDYNYMDETNINKVTVTDCTYGEGVSKPFLNPNM